MVIPGFVRSTCTPFPISRLVDDCLTDGLSLLLLFGLFCFVKNSITGISHARTDAHLYAQLLGAAVEHVLTAEQMDGTAAHGTSIAADKNDIAAHK